jgi:hypothetical protein
MKKLWLGAGAAAVLAAGAIVLPGPALGDQAVTYLDAQTFIIHWDMRRLTVSEVACFGICRTAAAGGTYARRFPIHLANQATPAACLVALASACTPGGGATE